MKGSLRSNASRSLLPKRNEGCHYYYNRFLKPGALARLRDSRVSARSQMLNSQIQISLSQLLLPNSESTSDDASSSPTEHANSITSQIDFGVPCFALRTNRPRCLLRKKLFAVAPVFTENEQL